MVKVCIVEDVKHIRDNLTYLLDTSKEIRVVGSYECAENLIDNLNTSSVHPHIVLMDIKLPGMNGIECTSIIKKLFPLIEIMMLTVFEDEEKVLQSIKAGATGYILKDTPKPDLIKEIIELSKGGSPITPRIARKIFHELKGITINNIEYKLSTREKEILKHIITGETYQDIADAINISPNTVRKHIQNIYQKLHVSSKAEVVAKAINEKLV